MTSAAPDARAPRYRMIAIDLDGTLLSPQGKVTERTKTAIHRALKHGLLICFATGRNWTESKMVLEAVEHYSSAVFVGGAMVVDTEKDVTLHRQLMSPDLAAELSALLESHGHPVLALQDTRAAGHDYYVSENLPLDDSTRKWVHLTRAAVKFLPTLADPNHHPHTVRVGIVAPQSALAPVLALLKRDYAERAFFQSIYVPAYDVEVLEIFDPSVNKWQGLLKVAAHHNIDPRQIIAVGDDLNDLAMIQHAGLGVAMGNARPEVKALAKQIIPPNSEDGLAHFLDHLIDSHQVAPLPAG